MAIGATAGVVVSLPLLLVRLRRSGRVLATTLWIQYARVQSMNDPAQVDPFTVSGDPCQTSVWVCARNGGNRITGTARH